MSLPAVHVASARTELGAPAGRAPRELGSGLRAARSHGAARIDRLRGPLVVGGLVAVATAYVAVVDPNRPGHYLVCPIYLLTGHYCAGCGALRATHDLAHGDLASAWGMNPLWVLVVPLLVAGWLRWTARSWRGSSAASAAPARQRVVWVPWVTLAVTLVYTALRNVPALGPWLAP
jgi:hypothetical protein